MFNDFKIAIVTALSCLGNPILGITRGGPAVLLSHCGVQAIPCIVYIVILELQTDSHIVDCCCL